MKCQFCDQEATKLCDKVVRKGRGGMVDPDDVTCDAPICDIHAETVGKYFDLPERGAIDSMDYCPHHSGANPRSYIKSVKSSQELMK